MFKQTGGNAIQALADSTSHLSLLLNRVSEEKKVTEYLKKRVTYN